MAVLIKVAGKNIPIVRSRAALVSAAPVIDRKMMADTVRSYSQSAMGKAVSMMRQAQNCSPDDADHKAIMNACKDVVTTASIAMHDSSYYGDSSAHESVKSSAAAADAMRKCMKAMSGTNCGKCSPMMNSAMSTLKDAAMYNEKNAGVDHADGDDDDSVDSGMKSALLIPDRKIALGETMKRISDKKFAGYLVRFTTPEKRDAEGEYFDADTDFMLGVFPVKGAMSLYNHGMDRSIGSCPIGTVEKVDVRADGIYIEQSYDFFGNYKAYLSELKAPEKWKQQQLAMAKQYDQIIQQMIEDGLIGWSSGAHGPSIVKSKAGHIDRWPIIEASATPIPAMPFETKVQPIKRLIGVSKFESRA